MATDVIAPITDSAISHRWDLFEESPELVTQRFSDMQGYATAGYNTAMAAIQALSNIGIQLSLINQTISIDTEVINEPSIDNVTPPTIDMSQFRVDFPDQPTQPSLIDATLDPIPNQFPDMVGPGDVATGDTVYVSNLMTALKAKILSDMSNGSTGIPDDVQTAMFQKNYERDLQEFQDEQDRIAASWGAGGFPMPNGGLMAAKDRASLEFTNKRLDVSRDIMIKAWETALNNMHFLIGQGVAIEGLMIKWAGDTAQRIFEASKAVIDSQIKSYEARVKGFSEKARIIIEKCKAKIEYNLGIIRMYEASVNAFASKMNAEAQRINAVARGYEAETEVFNAIVNFDVKKVDVDLKVIEARIQQAVANAEILIKDKDVQLRAYEALNSLLMEAQKSIGSIAAQVASGALSAVHAQVSIGASNSAGYNYTPAQTLSTGSE